MAFAAAAKRYIDLPIDGHTYRIHAPDAKTGLFVHTLFELGDRTDLTDEEKQALQLDDDAENDLDARLFGPTKDEMLANGVDFETFGLVRLTVFMWLARGRNVAERFWNDNQGAGDDGQPEGEAGPKSSAEDRKDQPASPAGSTTKKAATQPKANRKAAASTGTKSSASTGGDK